MDEYDRIWADNLLASINIPVSEQAREKAISFGGDAGLHLDLLVTDEVVDTVWNLWNPDQADRVKDIKFRKAFKHLLSECARLGFRLNRFRHVSAALPDPEDETAWAAVFEDVIAGQDRCKIRIYLSPRKYQIYLRSKQTDERTDSSWNAMLNMMRDGLFYEMGMIYPPFDVMGDESLQDEYFRIEWNDLRLPPRKGLRDDQALVNDTPDRLALLNVRGEPAVNPANGYECAVIDSADVELCGRAGLTTWDYKGYTVLLISSVLRQAAGAFINRYLLWYFLDALKAPWPDLVGEIKKQMSADLLVRILRGLIDEQISVRDSRTIFESLLSARSRIYADPSKYILFANVASGVMLSRTADERRITASDYVNVVRIANRRYISHKYTRGNNTLIVYLLDQAIEDRLRRNESLLPEERAALLRAVRYETGNLPPSAQNPVILTTHDIRLRFRSEIRHAFPHLATLSYQELATDLNIHPIARIVVEEWLKG